MTEINSPCFIMICRDETENECLERGLFGDSKWRFPFLKSINKGDIGFLLNITKDQLLGIFIAESKAQFNIIPNAWKGKGDFPVQVKVKRINVQKISKASMKLENIIELKLIPRDKFPYKVPSKSTYGPEITKKILSLFQLTDNVSDDLSIKLPEEIGLFPEYKLEDVAGLDKVKHFIYQRILAPFEDEQLAYELGLRIGGGLLLFGPPGTGKTLIAMAIAKHIQAKFIDISPSVIIGYPGEAERRIENIFASLDKEPRAVAFLDEAEWVLCKREGQASSVMQRITPLLLAQLSRIFKQKRKAIIVIAATNKPRIIDSAFLRPGRFDKTFYIGLPDKKARSEIIKMQLKNKANELNNDEILEIADNLDRYSGADIEHIIDESAFNAYERRGTKNPKITKGDIMKVIEVTSPSVTPNEVKQIKEWAKDRGIKI